MGTQSSMIERDPAAKPGMDLVLRAWIPMSNTATVAIGVLMVAIDRHGRSRYLGVCRHGHWSLE